MMNQLTQRDRRAIWMGGVAMVSIVLYMGVIGPWAESWGSVRAERLLLQAKVDQLDTASSAAVAARQSVLLKKVPAFELPQQEDKQRLVFRSRFNEQLKKAGLGVKSLKYQKRRRSKTGLKQLHLQYKGTGKFNQIMNLLASLNENPYLLSLEEFEMTAGQDKREEIELSLTLSTPVL